MDVDIDRYGQCYKIVIGDYSGTVNAFLLQNMFPILPHYVSHIHTLQGVPTPVSKALQKKIDRHFRKILHLHRKGFKVVFPDITRLERMMLEECGDCEK